MGGGRFWVLPHDSASVHGNKPSFSLSRLWTILSGSFHTVTPLPYQTANANSISVQYILKAVSIKLVEDDKDDQDAQL